MHTELWVENITEADHLGDTDMIMMMMVVVVIIIIMG
jgi:hypothetical protein